MAIEHKIASIDVGMHERVSHSDEWHPYADVDCECGTTLITISREVAVSFAEIEEAFQTHLERMRVLGKVKS